MLTLILFRRHPGGYFTRGDSSRIQYIQRHSAISSYRSSISALSSHTAPRVPDLPTSPTIVPSPSQPLSRPLARSGRRAYSTSEPYRDAQSNAAISSPMVRSAGSSTFSSSSRSWSPVTPTTQFPSPVLDGGLSRLPTFLELAEEVHSRIADEPGFEHWVRENRARTNVVLSPAPLSPPVSPGLPTALGGFAGLIFDDSPAFFESETLHLSPSSRIPLFVDPLYTQPSTRPNEEPSSFQQLSAASFPFESPTSSRPFSPQPPEISVSKSLEQSSHDPVVERRSKHNKHRSTRLSSSRSSKCDSPSSSLALLASAAQLPLDDTNSHLARSQGRARGGRPTSSHFPNAFNPYRQHVSTDGVSKKSLNSRHLSVPAAVSSGLVRSKSVGSTPSRGGRNDLAPNSFGGLAGSIESPSLSSCSTMATPYSSLRNHYSSDPILPTTQRPTSSVRTSPKPAPSPSFDKLYFEAEMSS